MRKPSILRFFFFLIQGKTKKSHFQSLVSSIPSLNQDQGSVFTSKAQKLQQTKSSHSSQDDPSYEKILEEAKINKICFSPDEPTYDFNKSYLEEIEIINSSNNVVKRFVHILSGNQLAIKQINIPHNRNNEKDYDKKLRQLIREIQSLNLLRDAPKVVQFYGACISEKQVWICMELMDMSLKDFYIKIHQESKHFPEELIGYIVVDILDALEFCQQSKIMYRDIKPDNLMLKKSTGEIKLTDFGESRFSEDGIAQTNQIGSTKYWPPERFTLEPYDVRSDVWSFGISLLETILGKYPYENINEEVKKNTIILQNLIKDTDPNRLVEMISNDYSKELEEFIGLCLKPLNERAAYEELKKSEFYRRYANKTKEDVKRLIGHLEVAVQPCQNTTTSDYGAGSYYPNELHQNIKSGSSEEKTSEDSTQLESGSSMEAYAKSECDYDLLEVASEKSTSSSSSSSSETSLKSLNIEKNPLDANAYFTRGNAQKNIGKYNEAIADFTKTIELNPTHVDAYHRRGNLQSVLGKYNEAIADYTKSIELNSLHADAYYNRGIAHKNLGKYNEAIADFTKAIELDPIHAHAYHSRKDAQDELEEYNKAIADYTRAIELNPLDVDAYKNRGVIQNKLGKYNEAIANYTKAIDLVPTQESTSSSERANSKTSLLLPQKEEQETNPSKRKKFSHDSVTSNRYIYEVFDNVHLIKFAISTQHFLLSDYFTFEDTLFSGNHVVQKFVHKQTNTQVAIKFINIPKDCTATGEIKEKLQKLKGEIDILQALSPSKLVTELYGYSIHKEKLLIYMEFMDMSLHDLYDLAHKKLSSFPEVLLGLIGTNGLDALIYLLSKKIMHRDVKPKNILVNKSGQIKLCDFGTSKLLNNSFATTWTGTVAYLPPEAFTYDNEKFDVRREVWALGLTIAEVAFGKYPIGEGKTDQYYISNCIKKATSEEIIRKSMQNFDDDIKEFVGLCLQELEKRPKYEPLKETQLYTKYLGLDRIQLFKETLENSNLF